jgi:hypothetical protein
VPRKSTTSAPPSALGDENAHEQSDRGSNANSLPRLVSHVTVPGPRDVCCVTLDSLCASDRGTLGVVHGRRDLGAESSNFRVRDVRHLAEEVLYIGDQVVDLLICAIASLRSGAAPIRRLRLAASVASH